ncbi:unnamed protein product [Durusdinium trenchii]|uniref:Phosphomannomutase n=1 Tax=Durusdinium trenchii TaxID=1381693 RepID=A0ABP0MP63_9DINO
MATHYSAGASAASGVLAAELRCDRQAETGRSADRDLPVTTNRSETRPEPKEEADSESDLEPKVIFRRRNTQTRVGPARGGAEFGFGFSIRVAGRVAPVELFAQLNEAHAVLSSEKRWAYDRQLLSAEKVEPEEATAVGPKPDLADADFDFTGDGRPFRSCKGRAARVAKSCGSREKAVSDCGSRRGGPKPYGAGRLQGGLLEQGSPRVVRQVIRHVGPMTPLGGLGELEAEGAQRSGASRTGCGHPKCSAHRLKYPEADRATSEEIFGLAFVISSPGAPGRCAVEQVSKVRDALRTQTVWWGPEGVILALFDVDGTLTEARKVVSPETVSFLQALRNKICVGVVGGSDLVKQKEQLGDSPALFDYAFSENGLLAFKDGQKIGETSIVQHLGEANLKKVINWALRYIADLDIPVKRGTFVEFRQGMLNLSPIGRNCSREERNEFEKFDLASNIRKTMVEKMKVEFADLGLTFSIGGQISFDVFPTGWDKTYCLRYLPEADFDEIHFFGDKTFEGGNDFEIFTHPRTIGHSIDDQQPLTTLKKLEELFGVPAPKSLTPPGAH